MEAHLSTCIWTQIDCHGTVERRVLERSCHTATLIGDHVYVIGGKRRSHFCDDVIRLNLKTYTWETVFSSLPFLRRANHSAVLMGKEIWVVGGMSATQVYQDVHVLDTETMEWSTPKLEGNSFLLKRCAHAACLHPTNTKAFLLFGGYGGKAKASGTYSFLNDLVIISTDKRCIELVKCTSAGEVPGRAYHTFVALGTRCFSIGGKDGNGTTSADHFLEVFDTHSCRWLAPPLTSGQPPTPRSSHKAGVVGSAILITGGVGAADAEGRFDDTAVLSVSEGKGGALKLSWNSISVAGGGPAARSAHALVVHRQGVLLLLGYKGGNTYLSDSWVLQSGSHSSKAADKTHAVGKAHAPEVGLDTTPTPDGSREQAVKAAGPVSKTTTPAVTKTPSFAALLLGGLARNTPQKQKVKRQLHAQAGVEGGHGVRGPEMGALGGKNSSVKGKNPKSVGVSSPGGKRPQQTMAEWRDVKRSKGQETPKALATPVPKNHPPLAADPSVYDLVASDDEAPQPNAHKPQPAANNNAADAVYIKKIKELEAQVSHLQSASKENRSQEAKLRTRCVALEAQVQDLTQDRERLQQLLTAAKRDLESKEQQVAETQQRLQEAEGQLARSQEEVDTLQQQLQTLQQDAGAAASQAAGRISALQKEVVEMRHQVAARAASSQQYQALADQRRKDAESVRHQLTELQGKLAEATKQLAITTQDKQQLEGMLREKDAATARLNASIDKLREESKQECIARERKIAEQAASMEQIKAENASLINSHEKLQDSLNSLSRAMEGAQKELREERRAHADAADASAQEKSTLLRQLEESERKLAVSAPELQRLRTLEGENGGQIQTLTRDLQAVKEREAALEVQLAQATAELATLRAERVQLSRQVESLRNVGSPLLGEARSLQAVVSTLVDKLQEHHSVLQPPTTPSVP